MNKKSPAAPLLQPTPLSDDTKGHAPDTKVAIPSDSAVKQAKKWVDENRL